MSDTENQIIELETKLAFMEDTVEQLNNVIVKQQNQLDYLKLQIMQLDKKIDEESLQWHAVASPDSEKPPHY